MRWKRHGDVGPAEVFTPAQGCNVENCERPHAGRGWCKMHLERWYATGDPLTVKRPSGGRLREDASPHWKGDQVTYDAVHRRLVVARGKAAEHVCRCGDPAAQWAYDHTDPDERRSPKSLPYSLDLDRYMPLCHSCHVRFDHGSLVVA